MMLSFCQLNSTATATAPVGKCDAVSPLHVAGECVGGGGVEMQTQTQLYRRNWLCNATSNYIDKRFCLIPYRYKINIPPSPSKQRITLSHTGWLNWTVIPPELSLKVWKEIAAWLTQWSTWSLSKRYFTILFLIDPSPETAPSSGL